MKRFLLTGVAFAAVAAGSARAADLPAAVPAYQPPPVVVAFNWTGCYVGGQIGGQWGSWTAGVEYPGVSATRAFDGTSSFIGGAQVGCNYQPIGSAFVVGIESDVIGAKNKFSGEVFRFGAGPTISMRPARSARRAACACALVRPGIGCWSTLRLV